jgi:hypothetical protein
MCCIIYSYGEYHSPKFAYNAGMLCLRYVVFIIVMIECFLSHSYSFYFETYGINGLTVDVYVPFCFNDVKKCWHFTV